MLNIETLRNLYIRPPIDILGLTLRVENALLKNGIEFIDQIDDTEYLNQVGLKGTEELKHKLKIYYNL